MHQLFHSLHQSNDSFKFPEWTISTNSTRYSKFFATLRGLIICHHGLNWNFYFVQECLFWKLSVTFFLGTQKSEKPQFFEVLYPPIFQTQVSP